MAETKEKFKLRLRRVVNDVRYMLEHFQGDNLREMRQTAQQLGRITLNLVRALGLLDEMIPEIAEAEEETDG